jgi:hypothetical protein
MTSMTVSVTADPAASQKLLAPAQRKEFSRKFSGSKEKVFTFELIAIIQVPVDQIN